jgi:hypothetical protein
VRSIPGEDRAVPGVEERTVLQQLDREAHRIQGAAARGQKLLGTLDDGLQRCVERRLMRLGCAFKSDGARTAMDRDHGRNGGRGHSSLDRWREMRMTP